MIKIEMQYKGGRSYLHGSDFFNSTSKELLKIQGAGFIKKLCFKSFARNQCFLLLDKRPENNANLIGNGIWLNTKDQERKFWITEGTEVVTERYPFDEELLVAPCIVEGHSIKLVEKNSFSTIENVIALTKKLNYTLTPDIEGKWVFGQIDLLKMLPAQFSVMNIERTSERKGKFTCNKILIDNDHVGEIRFIVGQP